MASLLGGTEEGATALCEKTGVQPSNFNSPEQIVISGEREKIERAILLSKEFGIRRAIPLAVAGAYHSRHMGPARDAFAAKLGRLAIRPPNCPVFSNVTGEPHGSDPDRIRSLLLEQITAPVRWDRCMAGAAAMGIELFCECGPGTVLSNLCRKNVPSARLFRPDGF
jgi:[acyl-carrier-protein] S-malonyltransferase